MVIGIDCTGSCKSNYDTITSMTAPSYEVLIQLTINRFVVQKYLLQQRLRLHIIHIHRCTMINHLWFLSICCFVKAVLCLIHVTVIWTFFNKSVEYQLTCTDTDNYWSLWHQIHYDGTNKNNNVSLEDLDIHYH
jgi:hypothetical protein